MWSGKHFRLNQETLGVESVDGERTAVMVPAGSVIRVVSGPLADDPRFLDVRWEKRELIMFAEDVKRRGEEVNGAIGKTARV